LAAAVAGPAVVIDTSDEMLEVVDAVAELFAEFGSADVEDTVAVLVTVPANVEATVYVLVMVTVAPEFIVPMLHGNAVVQPPVFDTNVRLAGVTSATDTPVAVLGPLLVTVTV